VALTRPDLISQTSDYIVTVLSLVPKVGDIISLFSLISKAEKDTEITAFANAMLVYINKTSGVYFVKISVCGGRKYECVSMSNAILTSGQFIKTSELQKGELKDFFDKGFAPKPVNGPTPPPSHR